MASWSSSSSSRSLPSTQQLVSKPGHYRAVLCSIHHDDLLLISYALTTRTLLPQLFRHRLSSQVFLSIRLFFGSRDVFTPIHHCGFNPFSSQRRLPDKPYFPFSFLPLDSLSLSARDTFWPRRTLFILFASLDILTRLHDTTVRIHNIPSRSAFFSFLH